MGTKKHKSRTNAAEPSESQLCGDRSSIAGSVSPKLLGDIGMRISSDGTWMYQGSAITRKVLVKYFAKYLTLEDDKKYYLVTPSEKCEVLVDRLPFLATALDITGIGKRQSLAFWTNVDDHITVNMANPLAMEQGCKVEDLLPCVLVRGRLKALIIPSVYYELATLAVEEEVDGRVFLGVWSGGKFFPLSGADDDSRRM